MYKKILILLMFAQASIAQTSITVSPLIIGKAYFCNYGGDVRFSQFYSEQSAIHLENPYYSFRAKKFSYRPSIDIGLKIDVNLKSDKHRFGLTWATDASGTMSKTTHFKTTNTVGSNSQEAYKTYSNNGTSYFQTGFTYNRVTLNYTAKIREKISWFDLHVGPEISLIFGQKNSQSYTFDADTVFNNSTYFHNDAKALESTISSWYYGKLSYLIGFGLELDFKIPKSQKDLFSLEISYKQGFKNIVHSQHISKIFDSGETIAISNELVGRGSGLYLTLSRKFKVYSR